MLKKTGTIGLVVATLMLALLAGHARAQAELTDPGQPTGTRLTGSPMAASIDLRVGGVVGEPKLISADGAHRVLTADSKLALGDTIETDADSRAAFYIAIQKSFPNDSADVLMLGPNTRVTLTVNEAKEPGSHPKIPPLALTVHQGTCRVVVVTIGGLTLTELRGPEWKASLGTWWDVVVQSDPVTKTQTLNVRKLHKGSFTIHLGERAVRVARMSRSIVDGKIRGAKKLTDEQWALLVDRTAVEGVIPKQREIREGAPRSQTRKIPTTASKLAGSPTAESGAAPDAPDGPPQAPVAEPGITSYVRFETTMGNFYVELDGVKAPISVKNFLEYVADGHYTNTIFHRVMSEFMIQGGGFDTEWKKKSTREPIWNESGNGLSNVAGTIAMARMQDPHSATSQFYINVVDNARKLDGDPPLRPGYAVFGKVVGGQDVIEKIRTAPVKTSRLSREPAEPIETIVITGVTVVEREEAMGEAVASDET